MTTENNNQPNQVAAQPSAENWLIMDCTGLLHRAYHAYGNMRAPDGHPNGVLHGTISLMHKYIKGVGGVDHAIAVFDPPGGSLYRLGLYPEYKKQRPPRPEEITRQEPWVRQFLEASGIPVISRMGEESDDIMGAIAKKEASPTRRVGIFSADKDMAQMIRKDIMWFKPDQVEASGVKRMKVKDVVDKFGVKPNQIVDFLTLLGDASDNLMGVDKVGEKTAAKLLQAFGTLDGIFELVKNDQSKPMEEVMGLSTTKKIWPHLKHAQEYIHNMRALVQLQEEVSLDGLEYATRLPVNDQLMEDMRAEHGLPVWMGYPLDWQQARIEEINAAKKRKMRP